MTFLIVTHAVHKRIGNKIFAYGPYVREMNIWLKYFNKVIIVAPVQNDVAKEESDLEYNHSGIVILSVPELDLLSIKAVFKTFMHLPLVIKEIYKGMHRADHIHLRCPGNIGLIGCIIQLFFPYKHKTAKYAGNWDWNSKQPFTYRLQQRILRNTFLTRNMTALVYGDWPDKTDNIKPFFTASYPESERLPVQKADLKNGVNLAFVGGLYSYKRPDVCLEVLKTLTDKGINARLTFCGNGPEMDDLKQKAVKSGITDKVKFLGNVNSETVKTVLMESHFLVFISKSEGWPKAVSEAMWWGCLPIASSVSCVPQMLSFGERGDLVNNNISQICNIITNYVLHPEEYFLKTERAIVWSQSFTLEKFESEVKNLLN